MIESIEGKRGMPRLRPPYVAQVGPVRPADARAQLRDAVLGARAPREGRRLVRLARPQRQEGPALVLGLGPRRASPASSSRRPASRSQELIDEYCGGMLPGHTLYGYLPGGASGGILPASLANIPLDFDTLQPYGCFIGSAAVVVLSDHDSAVGAARNTMRFFEHESCGQCTPCRNGTAKASILMASRRWDLPLPRRPVAGDARRVDLRPRPGGAEPDRLRRQVLSPRARSHERTDAAARSPSLDAPGRALRAERARRSRRAPTRR